MSEGWAPTDVVMGLNGEDSFSDDGADAVETLKEQMEAMTQRQRVVVFQVLCDFYCPRCGVDQPEGDCQCGADATSPDVLEMKAM